MLTITVASHSEEKTCGYRWQRPGQVRCPAQKVADFVTDRRESSVFLSEEKFGSTN